MATPCIIKQPSGCPSAVSMARGRGQANHHGEESADKEQACHGSEVEQSNPLVVSRQQPGTGAYVSFK